MAYVVFLGGDVGDVGTKIDQGAFPLTRVKQMGEPQLDSAQSFKRLTTAPTVSRSTTLIAAADNCNPKILDALDHLHREPYGYRR